MAIYTGRDICIGIGRESSRGTPVSATFWIPRSELTLKEEVKTVVDEQVYGVLEDSVDVKVVNKKVVGSLKGWLRDKAIGLFLLNMFGQVSSTPEGSFHKHTFTIQQGHQHPSLTIEVKSPLEGIAHPLTMLGKLEIAAEINNVLLFTTDLVGKVGQTATPTAAYAAENVFVAEDIKAYFANTAADLDAAVQTKIKSVAITMERNIEEDDVLGSLGQEDFLNENIGIEIKISKSHIDNTFRTMYLAGTGKAMRLAVKSGTPTSLQVNLNQVKIIDWEKDTTGFVKETFTAKGNLKIADAKAIEAILINSQANYN